MDNLKCTGLVLAYEEGQWSIKKIATHRGIFELEKNCETEEIQTLIANFAGFLLEQVKDDIVKVLEDEQKQE